MERKALENGADVSPLPAISSSNQNKAVLEWVHSPQCWEVAHAVSWPKASARGLKNYAEFQQLDSFAIKERAVALHITTYFPQCRESFAWRARRTAGDARDEFPPRGR